MKFQQKIFNFNYTQTNRKFENYVKGPNEAIVTQLKNLAVNRELENIYFLKGEVYSGKTFLLHCLCDLALEQGKKCILLPLKDLTDSLCSELFTNLDILDLLILDDIEKIAGCIELEEQIFHLFNKFKANGNTLMFSSQFSPAQIKMCLPDLKSRLISAFLLELKPLADHEKKEVLIKEAQLKGLEISPDTLEFLIRRYSREMENLISALDLLDQISLREQQKITIPFIKKWLFDTL